MLLIILRPVDRWTWLLGATGLLIAGLSKIPFLFWFRRLLLLEPFVAGISILMLFQPGGSEKFVVTVIKSNLCLCLMLLFSNTTPYMQILRFLEKMKVPPLFITTLALMYRYLFVLVDEMERMKRAKASRTFSTKQERNWSSIAQLAGVLFVRASERAERIYAAMCARGWKDHQ